jgi:simple sugar transport system ATP-binding protein
MTVKKLSELIVGREVNFDVKMDAYAPGETILDLRDVSATVGGRINALKDISIAVKGGEIVGIAGVEGNGQTELIQTIVGLHRSYAGDILLCGEDQRKSNIRKRRLSGIGHIPEDRLKTGTAKECTINENLILNCYFKPPYSRHGVLNNRKLRGFSEDLCKKYSVKTPDAAHLLKTLSGGNMQKVVVAREMEDSPKLLIAAQPTRGVDIGAIEYIYEKIVEMRDAGHAILLVSAELDEIMTLSDRIYIIYEGEIVGEFVRGEANEYEMGEYMLGAKKMERSRSSEKSHEANI